MPPLGLEESRKTRGKSIKSGSVPPPVPPSGSINQGLHDLIECWNRLGIEDRKALIEFAKRLNVSTKSTK
ncbi:MAG TPA: hypothetical protein PKD64_11465 [Pirellulaceae bacterium]|nr:hypothetical protein [Pirellulaceae bacterium]HMO92801.1 hypothetical protein [Pirellulaceae bacterium]HMP69383.1 hypothetical protein [Pirellulaceae bacterium]